MPEFLKRGKCHRRGEAKTIQMENVAWNTSRKTYETRPQKPKQKKKPVLALP